MSSNTYTTQEVKFEIEFDVWVACRNGIESLFSFIMVALG